MTTTIPTAPIASKKNQTQVIKRTGEFYWRDYLTEKMYGPFSTGLEAAQHMQDHNENGYEEEEFLDDMEATIGLSNWIDPETGEPSESLSLRLSDDD